MKCWSCCCSIFRKERREVAFLIIGLDGAGKSTVVKCLSKDVQSNPGPANSHQTARMEHGHYNVTLLDMAGSHRLRTLWKNFYSKVHGLVFVVDSAAVGRMPEAKLALEEVLNDDQIRGKPLLILANKQDTDDPLDEIAVFNLLGLETFQENPTLSCQVECCTASSRESKSPDAGMKSGLQWLMREVNRQYGPLTARVQLESAQQDAEEQRQKRERLNRLHSLRMERETNAKQAQPEVLSKSPVASVSVPRPKRRNSEEATRSTWSSADRAATGPVQSTPDDVPAAPTVLGSKRESVTTLAASPPLCEPDSPGSDEKETLPVRFPVTLARRAPPSATIDSLPAVTKKTSRSYKRRSKVAVEPIMVPYALTSTPHHKPNMSLFSTQSFEEPGTLLATSDDAGSWAFNRSGSSVGASHPLLDASSPSPPLDGADSSTLLAGPAPSATHGRVRLDPIKSKRKHSQAKMQTGPRMSILSMA